MSEENKTDTTSDKTANIGVTIGIAPGTIHAFFVGNWLYVAIGVIFAVIWIFTANVGNLSRRTRLSILFPGIALLSIYYIVESHLFS